MSFELVADIGLVGLCLALGGVLKGATGVGAPIIAIPAMVLMFDVRFAIVVMVLPNLMSNIWQIWKYWKHMENRGFLALLVSGGVLGVLPGTYALASLPSSTLSLLVASAICAYVALRLANPHWRLALPLARTLAFPAGVAAGFLQASTGLSAPVSITFLNAIRFSRPVFIASISLFFLTFTVFQLGALYFGGVMRDGEFLISAFAILPLLAAMPLGVRIAQKLSPAMFDRLILILLTLIALRLFAGNLF
jgi:uncharacterized membrane protein YfcA